MVNLETKIKQTFLQKLRNKTTTYILGASLLAFSCGDVNSNNAPSTQGCQANEDCKGDRVCYQGECVNPEIAENNYNQPDTNNYNHPDTSQQESIPPEPTHNIYAGSKYESTDEECSDGIDNDNNGHWDCGDFSCTFNPFITVCGNYENTNDECSDGIDNDSNGYTDCHDWPCMSNPFVTSCGIGEKTPDTCTDGIDNNNNGYADCEEYGCSMNPYIDECK